MKLNIVFLLKFVCCTQGYRILILFPVPSPSHFILGNTLGRALAETGHDVTVVSPFEDKNPPKMYRNVVLTELIQQKEERNVNFFLVGNIPAIFHIIFVDFIGASITKATLNHPKFKELLEEKFDLLIVDAFRNKALYASSWHFEAPLILFSTVGTHFWVNTVTGNPSPPSYIPSIELGYSSDMNFWQRSYNSVVMLFKYFNDYFVFDLYNRRLAEEVFPDCSDIYGAMNNVSFIFLNSHESSNQPVPTVPNMLNIGGFHIKPPQELPDDLKHFLNSATEGVVYFSMGSNLNCSKINVETHRVIVNALGNLKQQVIWKYNEDDLPGKPENIKLGKWFPQQDILAHPNVKLFITHGGMLSILETVHHGVPILALPVFADQKMNAAKAQTAGYGLTIPFSQITEEILTDSLDKLLNDPKYRNEAKRRSSFMRDRPIHPLDLAVYWTEFIARHKGAPHLRAAGVDLPWYQYLLLDVILFLALVIVANCIIIYAVCRKICCSRTTKRLKTE